MARKPPPRPTKAQPSRAPWLVAIVVALVAAAAIIAVVSSLGDDDDGGASGDQPSGAIVTGTVTVEGAPLPSTEDFEDDPAVGRPFPAIEGQDLFSGAPMAIPADGNPKVVTFLAHWCPHCQAEVPRITDWIAENGFPQDVDLYAVSTGVAPDRGTYPPASWLLEEDWEVPTMADSADGAAASAAGLTSYPFFVAVDAEGNVVARDSGELSIERFEELLELARGE
jgi:thiol-disulfide isomerase/thioredoxin